MTREIHAFSLSNRLMSVDNTANIESVVASLDHKDGNGILWQHPNLRLLRQSSLHGLLYGLTENPEHLIPFATPIPIPTALRTLNYPGVDAFGECIYSVKGVCTSPNGFTGVDVGENRRHVLEVRFGPDEAGRYKIEGASADLGGFLEIAKHTPELLVDFNGPIWQPLIVLDTKKPLVVPNRENGTKLDVEIRVSNLRRMPYTAWRIEDVLSNSTVDEGRAEIDRLRRIWGFDRDSHVYLRAIERWTKGQNMLLKARVRHVQVFDTYIHSPTKRQEFVWMNPHNIGLDGSTGDLANSRKYVDSWHDCNRGRREAVGGFLMYLMGVNKLSPRLLTDDNPFLGKSLELFLGTLLPHVRKEILLQGDFEHIANAAKETISLCEARVPLDLFLPGRSPVDMHLTEKEWMPFMVNIGQKIHGSL